MAKSQKITGFNPGAKAYQPLVGPPILVLEIGVHNEQGNDFSERLELQVSENNAHKLLGSILDGYVAIQRAKENGVPLPKEERVTDPSKEELVDAAVNLAEDYHKLYEKKKNDTSTSNQEHYIG